MYNIKSLTPQKALSETNNKELFGIVFKDFSQSLYDDYKDAMGDLADITKEELMAYGIKEQESQRLLALAELMKQKPVFYRASNLQNIFKLTTKMRNKKI